MIQNFQEISVEKFLERTKESNPDIDTNELRMSIEEFKKRKAIGELCNCGNPIWIAGSALAGKGCFTCITGESECSEDYEIK
jgi:hypothetical protein